MAKTTLASDLKSSDVFSVPYQDTSMEIWNTKYRLKNKHGEPIDVTLDDTFKRVARALSELEKTSLQEKWYHEFLWALRHGAIPAGRIISNAGAFKHKPATSTINCTVSGTIDDSMDDILAKVREAGLTLKAGCGIGYDFSTLRPRGAFVSGAGAQTSGPLSFMDIYDKMCFTVSSAGGRRGAQMGTMDIRHPDVIEFIRAKRENGRLRQFNLSLLITEEFINAVKNNDEWQLVFPLTEKEVTEKEVTEKKVTEKKARQDKTDLNNDESIVWTEWPATKGLVEDDLGRVACKIYRTVPARNLWNLIMTSTYDYAEPGFILIDNVNQMNNNWFCEEIRTTNPCGEQPLPPYGSCLLGSVNLTKCVRDPFTENAHFDWEMYRKIITIFTRMLDNVVEINQLPLTKQRHEIETKRRHGMGFLGLGSTLTMLRHKYGSPASIVFTEQVAQEMAIIGWEQAITLAQEKGPAPIMDQDFTVTAKMMRLRPEMGKDGINIGDNIKGKILHAKYSRYMQKLAEIRPDIIEKLIAIGGRFTHHSSIAPTGTISLSLANNASNGIEPSFAHHYTRNIIKPGKKSKESVDVYSFELLAYHKLINASAMPYSKKNDEQLPDYFITADEITPNQHVKVQAAAQRWIDSSISKTANVPTDFPFDDFKNIYMDAFDQGLKGCTTFRFNPEVFQGVLVKKEDLKNTIYQFTLEDGSTFEATGDEQLEYDGEIHTAANLYDALKEGYYGKF